MTTVTFDTHAAIRKLRDAGIQEPQAETIVDVFSNAVSAEHLATKVDLAALETRLIEWMAGIALCAATVAIAAAALIITVIRTLAGQ